MAQGISRRDALKLGAAAAGFGVLRMTSVAQARQNSDTLLKAGIVTDMHHTTRADSETRGPHPGDWMEAVLNRKTP